MLAYQTAWLKANYPAEYMAANLTNEINDTKKLTQYIAEARAMGIDVLPPDVNRSESLFTVSDGQIVYGLIGVKGVGEALVADIVGEREAAGPYKDFMDFLERVGVKGANKRTAETLIQAGCFDSLGHRRAELVLNLERAWDYAQKKIEAGAYGQASLFEAASEEEFPPFRYDYAEEWPRAELLRLEKQLLGFYVSGHPLDDYKELYRRSCDVDFNRLERANPDKQYLLIGQLVEWREILTKRGKKMAFGKVEGYDGSIEIVVFSDTLEKHPGRFEPDAIVFLRGKVDTERESPSFKVEDWANPAELREKSWRDVHIKLGALRREAELDALRDLLFASQGSCGVVIHVPQAGREVAVRAHAGVSCAPSEEILERLRETYPVAEVWLD